ncbi:MAG: glycoside hydrolase family 88 protein, partial [Bacteroidales bacterium]|nr:glycoside hydrolase family 88 protein [Bacteroidales bacterium]
MNNFYANTTECGFAVYDQNGNQTADLVDKKGKLDYVVGLVAKSIIEASQYYSQFEWAESFAKPWFLSIKNYGDNFYSKFSTSGGSLDDLNAVKLFIPLRAMTATDGKYPTTTTYGYTTSALNNAIKGLKAHNDTYSIGTGTLAETAGNTVAGGWWHKKDYENQMWLDGAYMGPALFAELVNYSGTTKNIDSTNDWNLIVNQFTILRNMCWNPTDKLLYHAFAADGGTNSTSHSDTWYKLSSSDPYVFHSYSYWGRAVGWYFLALVDILEQMEKANIASTDPKFTTLKSYLTETAEGLKARQDQATGGWYQILDEDGTYSASEYNNGLSHTTTYNYIESSATALFTAAYLKAIRLGYLAENDYKTVAVNGYKCLVNQFFSVDDNGNVNIFGSCRSAGLGGNEALNAAGKEKFRDGSKPYYLLGKDVAMVKKSEKITEGKVLGAFILAATEYERQYQPSMLLSNDLNKTYTLGPNESLSAEVLGEGTATYQWYNANTSTAITGATNASYIPTESGKYYCVITVNPTTAAKTRGASTEPYTITTSTADVKVTAAATTYTVTFNAGSNGTCSTKSLTQSTAGASITLPSVTANTGYTFAGWYTAAEGGSEVTSPYTPSSDVTLYAHYAATSPGGETHTLIHFTGKKPSDACVKVSKTDDGSVGYSTSYSVNYNNETYNTSLKIESKTVLTLELSEEACVSFVFYDNTPFKLDGVLCTPENGIYTATLSKGTHTITRNSDQPKLFVIDIQPTGPSITISTQPKSADYLTGATTVDPLTVEATLDGYTLSYQWYENNTNSNTGGTEISGATT